MEDVFRNYTFVEDEDGGEKKIRVVALPVIAADLLKRTGGWPRVCSDRLFVPSLHDPMAPEWLKTTDELFSWIRHHMLLQWSRNRDMVTMGQLLVGLPRYVPHVTHVDPWPHEPPLEDVWCPWRSPTAYASNGSHARALLEGFLPETPADAALIAAMLLTVMWNAKSPGQTPFFVITCRGEEPQGSGKSTIPEVIGALVGEHVQVKLGRHNDPIHKQLLSDVNFTRRLALLDNCTGALHSPELAEEITAFRIHGRAAYGRQASRLNTLVWAATTNDLHLSSDLASRAVVVAITRPAKALDFKKDKLAYVEAHRDKIISDLLAVLRTPAPLLDDTEGFRFQDWATSVLARTSLLDRDPVDVMHEIRIRRLDADLEGAGLATFMGELRRIVDAEHTEYLTLPKLHDAWNSSHGSRLGKVQVAREVRNLIRAGALFGIHEVTMNGYPRWRVDVPGRKYRKRRVIRHIPTEE